MNNKSISVNSSSKIFCIGMGKTGTTSLHKAFMRMGLKSIHHGPPDAEGIKDLLEKSKVIHKQILECKQQGEKLLTHIKFYDAYLDIGPLTHSFKILDKQYPGSKFIYTNRETDKWLESMTSHVKRNKKNVGKGLYETSLVKVDAERWRNTKEKHFKRVKEYFKDRMNDLLVMDITQGNGYDLLCPFLDIEMINEPFPMKNTAPKKNAVAKKSAVANR